MPGSSTIVIAREDLSIPGGDQDKQRKPGNGAEAERVFFAILQESRPDVIVLDLSNTAGAGVEAIRKIRERCGIPVLVVCAANDPLAQDYPVAGAAGCIASPVDIIHLNNMIQHIIKLTRPAKNDRPHVQETRTFAGVVFRPDQNTLSGANGISVRLTTAENDILSHFLSRARTVCSRAEIAQILYDGRCRPATDRAIDVIVNRLRKKLVSVQGPAAGSLVKTEFRRGYVLVADVSTVPL
jgi:two-component system, OmpR family, response regulator